MTCSAQRARRLVVCLSLTVAAPAVAAGQTSGHDAVRNAAARLLDAISARDTAAMRELMLPGAMTVSVVRGPGTAVRSRSLDQMLGDIGGADAELLERMWDPEIRIDGRIATVWTPYDFYVGREFSHCGTDAFQFVDTGDGWKVVSILYTVVRGEAACGESPLGPPW